MNVKKIDRFYWGFVFWIPASFSKESHQLGHYALLLTTAQLFSHKQMSLFASCSFASLRTRRFLARRLASLASSLAHKHSKSFWGSDGFHQRSGYWPSSLNMCLHVSDAGQIRLFQLPLQAQKCPSHDHVLSCQALALREHNQNHHLSIETPTKLWDTASSSLSSQFEPSTSQRKMHTHQEASFLGFRLRFPRNVQDSARSHQKGSVLYKTLTLWFWLWLMSSLASRE